MIIKNEDLKKVLNKNLEKYIVQPKYEYNLINALDALTPDRFDIVAKYIYVKHNQLKTNTTFSNDLYLKHVNCFNGYVENDGTNKVGKNAFLNNFNNVINSIEKNGFIKENLIPLSQGYTISDGAHRVASSIFFEVEIATVSLGIEPQSFNYKFFEERGLDRIYLDAMALEYVRLKDNVYMTIIWPTAEGNDYELHKILESYGKIVYSKEIFLNSDGLVQLVRHAYRTEAWLGTFSNDFEGARNKARWCFKEPGLVRVFLLESERNLVAMKEEIRNVFKIEKHAVHINDTKEETLELAELLFNQNSINWMNNSSIKGYKKFNILFSKYNDWFKDNLLFSKDSFILVGGVLAIYGVRESYDIDYISTYNKEFSFGNDEIEMETKKSQFFPVSIDELIFNPKYYFYAHGQKFLSLDIIKAIKQARGIGKDFEDVVMLESLIKNGRYKGSFQDKIKLFTSLSFWTRNIKFFLLKCRFFIFIVIAKIKQVL